MQFVIHFFLHFGLPVIIAWLFYKSNWKLATLLLWSTMLVDVDHLWAKPIYDACRCSIGFHTFHSKEAIIFYIIGLFFNKARIFAIGLLLHMLTDYIDCFFITLNCK